MELSELSIYLPKILEDKILFGICNDSRKVESGFLFLAYPGLTNDGRQYIDDAIDAGAALVFTQASKGLPEGEYKEHLTQNNNYGIVFSVASLSAKASELASAFYSWPSKSMVCCGVTGTNGKTTCTYLLAQLFHLKGIKAAIIGTTGYGLIDKNLIDTGMTTPDAIVLQSILYQLKEEGAKIIILEASSHALLQDRLRGINFVAALFTNLTRDHLDYHETMENYLAAKLRLFNFQSLSVGIVNGDDPASKLFVEQLMPSSKLITSSLHQEESEIVLQLAEWKADRWHLTIKTPLGLIQTQSKLIGEFNLSNLLLVTGAAIGLGLSKTELEEFVPKLQPPAGRLQLITDDTDNIRVLVDYAHTPDALEKLLTVIRPSCSGKLWCLVGCGGDRDKGKRTLMAEISMDYADFQIFTSDNPRTEAPEKILNDMISELNQEPTAVIVNRQQAIEQSILRMQSGDTLVIAGKGHENYQEINGVRYSFIDSEKAESALKMRKSQTQGDDSD